MAGFEAIYTQTATLFNRVNADGDIYWYPTVLENVHLIIDKAVLISTYGEHCTDNARLHIRYTTQGGNVLVQGKKYRLPKEFRRDGDPEEDITFTPGDEFDFIMEGEFGSTVPVKDSDFRSGFFNYMNRAYDNVFAITSAAKFNLIPHFEIGAR